MPIRQLGRLAFLTLVGLGGLLFSAPQGRADPINDRTPQVTLGASWDGPSANLSSIFSQASGLGAMGADAFDPANDQSPYALWTPGAGQSATTIVLEIAGYSPLNQLGIYSAANNLNSYGLFAGSASSGDDLTLTFVGGHLWVDGLDQGLFDISDGFGFYLHSGNGKTYYTEDSRNGGVAQALVFQGQGGGQQIQVTSGGQTIALGTNDWVIGFEDLDYGSSDKDFNDFVFVAQNITPVPEPSSLAFLALAIGGGAFWRKRWSKKA